MNSNGDVSRLNSGFSEGMYDGAMPNKVDDMADQILRNHYPLHLACRDGDENKVRALMMSGQHDVYEEDGLRGWTPMHWAASVGSLKCLMVLSECGVNIDGGSHRVNQSPLHVAAQHGSAHCLLWLVNCGAGTGRQDHMGDTPLHKAVQSGSLECVAVLANQGPAISIQNHNGRTPLDEARIGQKLEIIACLEQTLAMQGTNVSFSTSAAGSVQRTPIPTPHILMNGEPIYVSQGGCTNILATHSGNSADQEMEMEDEELVPAESIASSGVKRSRDDDEDSAFKRQRFLEPSASEKVGTAFNNNVLSSYNAVLAMSVEPVKGTNSLQNSNTQAHVSPPSALAPSFPLCSRLETPFVATSSVLEHCHSLQAQQGYDSSLITSFCNPDDQ